MELDELLQRIQNQERVQAQADKPEPEPGFTMQELKADNEFLRDFLKEKEDKLVDIQQRLDLVLQQQNNSYKQIKSASYYTKFINHKNTYGRKDF